MPNDAPPTIKFPKVESVTGPLGGVTSSFPPGGARSIAPRSSLAPEWTDEVATARTSLLALPVATRPAPRDRALLTILTGLNAGQVFTLLQAETIIGRGREAHVRIEDVGISRKHARVVRTADGRHLVEDLGSTNGVFVTGKRVERADLANGDRVQIGSSVVLRFSLIDAEEEALARQLYEGSTRDTLTRTYNRKYLNERIAAEVAYSHRHKSRLSLVLLDLDHFKRVNDTQGHLAGDVVLRVVAAQVQRLVRAEDVLARYGGEEFVVLVRGIAHKNVLMLAERIRKAVEKLSIPWEGNTLRATLSLGVASLEECGAGATVDALILLADERMYKAKSEGRNRVGG